MLRRATKRRARTVCRTNVDVAPLASLFADPTRAAVIGLLMSGTAHSAGELARRAGVAPSTMTGHLQRLLDCGAVEVRRQGRHRYYRLADPAIAGAYEALAVASRMTPVTSLAGSSTRAALADTRTCYDHLAGRLGCELSAALLRRRVLEPASSCRTCASALGAHAGGVPDTGDGSPRRRGAAGAGRVWPAPSDIDP
jgi:DNA-binding transcriptional ArsR family regulator